MLKKLFLLPAWAMNKLLLRFMPGNHPWHDRPDTLEHLTGTATRFTKEWCFVMWVIGLPWLCLVIWWCFLRSN